MKKTNVFFTIIMVFCICNFAIAQLKSNNCKKSVDFGNINICMPDIDGMIECYNKPIVKEFLDKQNPTENPIFAFYLKKSDFNNIKALESNAIEDYFVIYGLNKMKNVSIDNTTLNSISNIIENGFIKENWESIREKIKNNYFSFTYGRPVLIQSYSLNSKMKTFVLLSKNNNEDEEKIQVQVMNYIQIKKRLISLSYYLDYRDENSLKFAKAKNDYITLLLLEENN